MKFWVAQAAMAIVGILTLARTTYAYIDYVNSEGEDFEFDCDPGHALTGLMSGKSGRDRLWDFTCSPVVSKAKEFCEETGNVSSFNDKLIAFLCPSNAYIAGVRSFYNQGEDYAQDDRLWGFKCCRTLGLCTRKCGLSGPLNYVNGTMYYNTPDDHYVNGFFGTFYEGDRLYRVERCKLAKCGRREELRYIFPLTHY